MRNFSSEIAPSHGSEPSFVTRCANNQPGYRTYFIERYTAVVRSAIIKVFRQYSHFGHDAVDDLIQDVFVALFDNNGERMRSFEGRNGCSLETWLRVVASRQTLNYLRRPCFQEKPHEKAQVGTIQDSAPHAEKILLQQEQVSFVKDEIKQLSDIDRLVFQLLYEDGFSYDEAAAVCQMTKGALYTRVSRIKDGLRRKAESAGLLPY